MKKTALLAVVLLFSTALALAQTAVLGKVTDEKGNPLSGVTVFAKGSGVYTLSKADGTYSLEVPANVKMLTFTYVGFFEKQISVKSNNFNVTLQASDVSISEVVVTGYKARSKREFAGSAGSIKGEAIRRLPIASFDQALQGQTAGVILRATSGQPGNSGSTIIRGRGSLQGSTEPIYVLDGIQIAAADFALINPNDIENVSVLKDAVAAAVYGSRGGNGVIVVTTRKGKSGKPNLEVEAFTGWSRFPEFNDFRLMNTNEKIDYELRRGGTSLEFYSPAEIDSMRKINTDWEKELTRVGRTYSLNGSASGGSENTKYFSSVNYYKQEGTLKNTSFDRITGRINLNQEAGNFSFGMNTTGTFSNYSNTSEINTSIATPLNALQWTNPYEQPFVNGRFTPAGRFLSGGTTLVRPRITETGQPIATTELYENTNGTKQYRVVAAGNAEYKLPFIEGLVAKIVYGVDYRQFESQAFINRLTYSAGSNPRPTSGTSANFRTNSFARDYSRSTRTTNTNSLTYAKKIGEHSFDLGAYYEFIEQKTGNTGNTTYSLTSPFRNEAAATINADLLPRIRGGGGNARLQSYFGTLNYGFKNKYFFNGNLRRDGSSRFGGANRYATFGGGGVSWIVSDESFMSTLKSKGWLNSLKFKASYGIVGNQEGIGFYEAQGTVANRLYNSSVGSNVTLLENADLQWESRAKFNTGLEFTMLNNRINANVEYYNEKTENLFFPTELSRTTGFANLTRNVGSVRNSGVEVSLNGDIIKSSTVHLNFNGNVTFNKNEIVALADKDSVVTGTFDLNVRIKGQPINRYFLVEYAGVNPANGNAQYRKLDGTITEDFSEKDRRAVGNSDPNIFGGFGFNLDYKGFALNTQFSYMLNMKVYNNERNNLENPDYYYDNINADLLNEWQKAGDITNIPSPGSTFYSETTRFLEDNSFIRLRNISLTYSLPQNIANKIKMSGISIYVAGTNLWTSTNYRGRDPEFPGTAVNGGQYPALKTVQTGIRLNF